MAKLFVAFDVESTGQGLETDTCFAIGYCIGRSETNIVERGKWVVKLPEQVQAKDWRTRWETAGWEMRCYDEFWSKHENMIDDLMANANCTSEQEMFTELNKLLRRLEANPAGFTPVFDTLTFDSVWLCQRLQRYGFADLAHYRDHTGYRSSYELDSLRLGLEASQIPERVRVSPHLEVSGAHDPEVDAYNIFVAFMALYEYATRDAA